MRSVICLFPLVLLPSFVSTLPSLENIKCSPSKVALGGPVNITWTFKDDAKNPARGVFSWQLYAQDAVIDVPSSSSSASSAYSSSSSSSPSSSATEPLNGPASTSLLTDPNFSASFDWYQYGPHGLVNYTGQHLCLDTSLPYGPVDGLGNPKGYTMQTFCPLKCEVEKEVDKYTYFKTLSFSPKRVHVGDDLEIKWTYTKGVNVPKDVIISISFTSDYFEEPPQWVIPNVPTSPRNYTLKVTQSLRDFVTTNAKEVDGRFPYALYVQLAFPPQTNALGMVVAKGNLTVLAKRKPTRRSLGAGDLLGRMLGGWKRSERGR
ncbi:hypothetical protein HKX48_006063 [Thoreauomyces humboldtii]|nr:hypothetical protein HKX48_006063 [Thoreauomyces humboldtii]